tara:strand:+ start:148 stop:741 length:594 start_codon:yes stop_codon:yes gene_type:complete
MKLHHYTQPIPYIVVEDTYDDQQLKLIWQELQFYINNPAVFEENTGAAEDEDGTSRKRNSGFFLDGIYHRREVSNILTFNRWLYNGCLNLDHWYWRDFKPDTDYTLVSYYEEGDYYRPHCDKTMATAVTWLFREPKKFTGGDFLFPEFDISINVENNVTVVFPGLVQHAVTPIEMKKEDRGLGLGRYCISQFMNYDS